MATFMNNDLVLWLQTHWDGNVPLTYNDICDGVFLNKLFHVMDPSAALHHVIPSAVEVKDRFSNWDILVQNIRRFYTEVLRLIILIPPPNIIIISREPESLKAQEEIEKTILLMLGAAVQCDRKEHFITTILSRIQDKHVQSGIMNAIQEITDENSSYVIPFGVPVDLPESVLMNHLRLVCAQRDTLYLEESREMVQQIASLHSEVVNLHNELQMANSKDKILSFGGMESLSGSNLNLTGSGTSVNKGGSLSAAEIRQHAQLELAEAKAKLRKLRLEVDEKTELTLELREELEEQRRVQMQQRDELTTLQRENRHLKQMRDELDAARERVQQLQCYELELARLKQQIVPQAEYYKQRCQELSDDISILSEEKQLLVQQLESEAKRVEKSREHEIELKTVKRRLADLEIQLQQGNRRYDELQEDFTRLQLEHGSSMNASASLKAELLAQVRQSHDEDDPSMSGNMGASFGDTLTHTAQSKVFRLELENRRLLQLLQELKEAAEDDKEALVQDRQTLQMERTHVQELQKEIVRLQAKVKSLQDNRSNELQSVLNLEQDKQSLQREKNEIRLTLETTRSTLEQQISELQHDNNELQQTIIVLRERETTVLTNNVSAVEKENASLVEQVNMLRNQLSELRQQHRKVSAQLSQSALQEAEAKSAERELTQLRSERDQLKSDLVALRSLNEEYLEMEHRLRQIDIEKSRLQRQLEQVQSQLEQKMNLEEDLRSLKLENELLKKIKESLSEDSSARLIELGAELDSLHQHKRQLEKDAEKERQRALSLESKLVEKESQCTRLEKQLEHGNKRLENQTQDVLHLEEENASLRREIDSYKLQLRHLDQSNQERERVEQQLQTKVAELHAQQKEVRRLKSVLEHKTSQIDELNGQIEHLESQVSQYKEEVANKSVNSVSEEQIQELEKDRRDLLQQKRLDKKTLAALREELVKEKVSCQQLQNELSRLKEQMTTLATLKMDDSLDRRFEALETLLESTVTESLSQKDKQILSLESRLQESSNRNKKMWDELTQLTKEHEGLKQRYDEEITIVAAQQNPNANTSSTPTNSANTLKQLLDLKDRLIILERANAKLENTNTNLEQKCQLLEEKTQRGDLQQQEHWILMQKQNTELMSLNAKLQVEHTSLTSENQQLRRDHTRLIEEHTDVQVELEHLRETQIKLTSDLQHLQQLHNQLTHEYENMQEDFTKLKEKHRDLFLEFQEKVEELSRLRREAESVKHLKEALEKEKNCMEGDAQTQVALREKLNQLQAENMRINESREELNQRLKQAQRELREARKKFDSLQVQQDTSKSNNSNLEKEMTDLANKAQTLVRINGRLEDENKNLLLQLKSVLTQNQDLLTQTLENKEHHHAEEVALRDRLMTLQRQKERLEEKIIDQYKRSPSPKKKKSSLGVEIIRRARELVTGKRESNNLDGGSSVGDVSNSSGKSEEMIDGSSIYSGISSNNVNIIGGSIEGIHEGNGSIGRSHLIPGSVSVYDRDPNENDTSHLRKFLMELHRSASIQEEATNGSTETYANTQGTMRTTSRREGMKVPPGMQVIRQNSSNVAPPPQQVATNKSEELYSNMPGNPTSNVIFKSIERKKLRQSPLGHSSEEQQSVQTGTNLQQQQHHQQRLRSQSALAQPIPKNFHSHSNNRRPVATSNVESIIADNTLPSQRRLTEPSIPENITAAVISMGPQRATVTGGTDYSPQNSISPSSSTVVPTFRIPSAPVANNPPSLPKRIGSLPVTDRGEQRISEVHVPTHGLQHNHSARSSHSQQPITVTRQGGGGLESASSQAIVNRLLMRSSTGGNVNTPYSMPAMNSSGQRSIVAGRNTPSVPHVVPVVANHGQPASISARGSLVMHMEQRPATAIDFIRPQASLGRIHSHPPEGPSSPSAGAKILCILNRCRKFGSSKSQGNWSPSLEHSIHVATSEQQHQQPPPMVPQRLESAYPHAAVPGHYKGAPNWQGTGNAPPPTGATTTIMTTSRTDASAQKSQPQNVRR